VTTSSQERQVQAKRHRVGVLLGAGLLVSFLALLSYGLTRQSHPGTFAQLDQPALNFQVRWVSGAEHFGTPSPAHLELALTKGRPTILNFWASWCVSCRAEARELEAFWQKHSGEVLVVGIAIQDSVDQATKFAHYYGKTYPLGLDLDGRASIDYGVVGVPETFFLDGQGIIRHKITGPVDHATLAEGLAKITGAMP
jgi:cytochrome c biogenesis protein CcmG, thiol:disulfide interchange protein DsbE